MNLGAKVQKKKRDEAIRIHLFYKRGGILQIIMAVYLGLLFVAEFDENEVFDVRNIKKNAKEEIRLK